MDSRFERLADIAVHGANVQPGQVVIVGAEIGQEEQARMTAAAAYKRGAKFVDVEYFDPFVKRARVANAEPDTLSFVPAWYGDRLREFAEGGGSRIQLNGITATNPLDGLDPSLAGKVMLPRVKEWTKIVGDRSVNWCIVPAPHIEWAKLVHPELPPDDAYEKLWSELEHVLRLDEPDPAAAWDARMGELKAAADRMTARAFDAIELRGPGTELTVGLLPTHRWWSADFQRADGLRHLPNLPTEEVFTTPDPLRTNGHVTSTKPLALRDGTIVRGLRVRFEDGVAVEITADENGAALESLLEIDDGAQRLGELALVDRRGRIGPLDTVFYSTLLDENAASHIALGSGFPFLVDADVKPRVNDSSEHIDFMIGSLEVEVDGITAGGEHVPVLRGADWQI